MRDARFAEAWTNRSSVLQDLHRYDEAMASLDRALALRPDHATNWLNRGNLHFETARTDDALAAYDRAIALQPDYAEAHFARASLYLIDGDFARGWPEYEWRLRDATCAALPAVHAAGVAGRHAARRPDRADSCGTGFGDTLQFCRYVPLVAERGARVVFEVQPQLRALMASLPARPT